MPRGIPNAAKGSNISTAAVTPHEANEKTMVEVYDTLAVQKPRNHELIVGTYGNGQPKTQVFPLSADSPTKMELGTAMVLLKDSAFIVIGPDGERIEPIPVQKDGGIGGLVLKPNEVIADLSELSGQALFKRCKVQPGSQAINETSTIEEMVAFLTEKATPKKIEDQDGKGDTLSQSVLSKMIGELEPA